MKRLLDRLKFRLGRAADSIQFAKIAEEQRLAGQMEKAVQICLEGLKKYPAYSTGHYILARCYIDQSLNIEAKEALVEALRFDPHHIPVLSELAGLYQGDGNLSQALYYYHQILAIDPLNTRIRSLVASLSDRNGTATSKSSTVVEEPLPAEEEVPVIDLTAEEAASVDESYSVEQDAQPVEDIQKEATTASPVEAVKEEEASPVVSGIPVIVSGPWVAELFQDVLPARGDIDPGTVEDQWPTRIFESLLAIGKAPPTAIEAEETVEPITLDEPIDTPVEFANLPSEPEGAGSESAIEEPAVEVVEVGLDTVELPPEVLDPPENIHQDEMPALADLPEVEAEHETGFEKEEGARETISALAEGEYYLDQFFMTETVSILAAGRIPDTGIPLTTHGATVEPSLEKTASPPSSPVGHDVPPHGASSPDVSPVEVRPGRIGSGIGQRSRMVQAVQDEDRDDDGLTQEGDPQPEAIPTATLAELYVRQGLLDRAIAVYLTLIEHDPTNPDIHKRLSELFVIKAQQENP